MATSSLHPPSSSNPFRDPNRTTPTLTPQPTGSSGVSLNPFLAPAERVSPQATGASQYFTPQHTGAITSQATGAFAPHSVGALNTQNTGASFSSMSPIQPDGHAPSYTSPPPSHNTPPPISTPRAQTPSQSIFAPPPGPPPQSTFAPPPGPPPPRSPAPAPRAPSPTPTITSEPPPPYTAAADVRHGEVPLETGPRRAYAPEWHPDGQTWRNQEALSSPPNDPVVPSPVASGAESQWDSLTANWSRGRNQPSASTSRPSAGGSGWSGYPGQQGGGARPPPGHPSGSQSQSNLVAPSVGLGRANTTAGTVSRPTPGPPTSVPTPGRALLNHGKVLAYPARYECNRCHLTGYQAYDPSNPCQQCWSLFAQPYEGILSFAPWDQPESVTSDDQNLQRPLPASTSRPQIRTQAPSSSSNRPLSHPQHSSYGGRSPGGLPPAGWSASPSGSSLRPQATVSYSRRPPAGSLVVQPGDPRIGGRVCWKCSGEGWQYKTMGLETKTCSACNGLGRLF